MITRTRIYTVLTLATVWMGAALTADTAIAALIITPTSADSTTTIGGSRTIVTTIDSSDLSDGGVSGDILSETHDLSTDSAGYWLSSSTAMGGSTTSATEILTFTLPEASDVDAIHMWTYNRGGDSPGRELRTFDISFSTDTIGTPLGSLAFPTTITGATLGDFLDRFALGTVDGEIPVQSKTFALQSGVTHIRFTNLTSHGSTSYVGTSEIRFSGPAVVPEPSALMLAAVGMMGLVVCRRRRNRK